MPGGGGGGGVNRGIGGTCQLTSQFGVIYQNALNGDNIGTGNGIVNNGSNGAFGGGLGVGTPPGMSAYCVCNGGGGGGPYGGSGVYTASTQAGSGSYGCGGGGGYNAANGTAAPGTIYTGGNGGNGFAVVWYT